MRVLHENCEVAGADFGKARICGGAPAGCKGWSTAGHDAGRVVAGVALPARRWNAARWRGCGAGSGTRGLVDASGGVAGEIARHDGRDARSVPPRCSATEVRREWLFGDIRVAALNSNQDLQD